MKLLSGSRDVFILTLGVCVLAAVAWVGSGAQIAQQNPAATSAQPDAGAQSFTVQPGTQEDEEPAHVLHVTTRRVVVDVVVTGPDGKPLSGLTEKDFTVLEDHKPQSVRAFEVHTPEVDRSILPPAPAQLPSHTFVNLEQTPASGPPVVVFIDFLNTPVTDQAYAHQQIVHFIEQKPASTEVAIFALGNDLTMLQGFTTDSGKLLAAMRSKAAGLRMPAATEDMARAQTTLDALFDIGRFLAAMTGRKNLLWFSESFNMLVLPNAQDAEQGSIVVDYENGSPNPGPGATVTTANLTPSAAAMGLSSSSASGFSQGIGNMMALREQLRKVATALAVSQTAVYPIDVRGLTNDPGLSASAGGPSNINTDTQGRVTTVGLPTAPGSAPANLQSHNDFLLSMNATQATMNEIASATGGHAFVNTNGLAVAAEQAVTEGSAYYTLVYAPSNTNFDGGLRSIHVKLDKPGCKLAYRSAYYAVDPATISREDARSGALAAVMVRGTPDAQGLLFKAQIDPEGAPVMAAPDSPLGNKAAYHSVKKSKKPQFLSGKVQPYKIRLAILIQQLQLAVMPDGRRHAALELAVYAYAVDGQLLGGTTQKLEAAMPPVIYAQAIQNGMFHNLTVDLPVEAASLRLAILDPGNHHTGSLEVALPIAPEQQAAAVPVSAQTN